MRALDDLSFDALRDYARDLLHQRGEAAGDINRRRQELPYHPLLAQYQQGSEALRARLSRVAFALLSESAAEPWPVEVLHYLLTLVEEIRLEPATETLKSLVNSRAWLDQPEGAKRQMFALRTLLGLGWLGDPKGWLRQHRLMDRAYPALVFRALAAHDVELAFGHIGSLAGNTDHAQQVLRLFPSLIERHSLVKVRDLAKGIVPGLSSEVASTVSTWFEKRDYSAQPQTPMMRRRQPAAGTDPPPAGPEDLRIAPPDGQPIRMIFERELEFLEHGSLDSKFLTLGVALVTAGGTFGVTLLATSSAAVWVKALFSACAVVGLVNGSLLLYLWRRSHQKTASLAQKIRQRMPPDDQAMGTVEGKPFALEVPSIDKTPETARAL